MAFTITFTATEHPTVEAVQEWLTEEGEPFELVGPSSLQLRALPVQIVTSADAPLQARLEINTTVPLQRLIDLLFAISIKSGTDVSLAGKGDVSRPELWLLLADDQDRQRIDYALQAASDRGNSAVARRLWALLSALEIDKDLRWNAKSACVVELKEVGAEGGLTIEEANWLSEDPHHGDVISVPTTTNHHILAWRWLKEAYPGLIEEQ